MSDDFEDLVKRWLRDRGATDRSALEAMAGHVAVLPPRRRLQPGPMATAAAVVVAIGLAAFALAPRQGSVSSQPSSRVPPDPAAFAGDPRLARCGATVETALDVFEMTHARDYRLHLPAMLLAPELDVDAPGFVVVYRDEQPFPVLGAPPPPGQTWPPRSLVPGHHDICVLVGADPASAELNVNDDVDIAGLTATVVAVEPSSASGTASLAPPSPPSADASTTAKPGPAWAGDALSVLQCDGTPVDLGSEGTPNPDEVQGGTPVVVITIVEQRAWVLRLDVPFGGFEASTIDEPARLFVHRVDGRVKAAIAVTTWNGGPVGPWVASSVASCGDAELDPTTPTGAHPFGRWTDASGAPVVASVLSATADCYDGTQVTFKGRLYVRAPKGGVDPSQTETRWASDVPLPATAVASPYRSGALRLFVAADRTAIYLATGDRAERLPHVIGDEVMRTDCN
jgi:hypothetical protein